jgi:NAD+ kinase
VLGRPRAPGREPVDPERGTERGQIRPDLNVERALDYPLGDRGELAAVPRLIAAARREREQWQGAAMSKRPDRLKSSVSLSEASSRIGVVVHPSRNIDQPLRELREWSDRRGVDLVQVQVLGQRRVVAEPGYASECDLIVSIGGDGTMLAAIRAAAMADRAVLGIACGSLGVLTSVAADGVARALERFSEEDWVPVMLPALELAREDRQDLFALNDVAIIRSGEGQLRTTAELNGVIVARFAGDGCVVSTPVGSSGYALGAGGPLMAPGIDGFLLTPLSAHGGRCPPLVISADTELHLDPVVGHGGGRLEVDGQVTDSQVAPLTISFTPDAATLVSFADQEPLVTRLRRRRIIIDSPRILAEDALL